MIKSKSCIAKGDGTFVLDYTTIALPKEDEVIVKMKAAGICHTDYDSLNWGKPIVMGHEGAGIVEQVGLGITDLTQGDHVILNWATPCGECIQCGLGNQHICDNNSPVVAGGNGYTPGHAHLEGTQWKGSNIVRSFNLGTLSEYVIVKRSAIVKNETKINNFSAAAIISCGVMTGYGSVINSAKLQQGSSAVVLGCGGVGLNVINACAIAGAKQIIAVDINDHKLSFAKEFGATHTILADKNDKQLNEVAQQVKTLLGGQRADYAFECTAVPELGAAPLAMVRNAGTAVQVSGIEQEITIDMRLFEWDKIYINPLYGKCNPQVDFPKIYNHYQTGQLKLDQMITREYALDEMHQALDDLLAGTNAKGVVVFD